MKANKETYTHMFFLLRKLQKKKKKAKEAL